LRTIDIPHSTEIEPFPAGPDPKTWDGPWRTINDPSTIAKHICAANSRHYHQAHNTPCGKEPLASYLGYKADTPGSKKVLDGENLPPELAENLLPETLAIFRTLQSLAAYPHTIVPTHNTLDQFISCYKAMDERTSSSPSGRHLGHYKAAILSEELATVHSTMMSIPLTAGISPSRWRQIIDVMLEKKPGDHRIHGLQIVALQESNFNQSNRLTIGRPLQSLMETINLAPDMQHGSRASKLCHSAVLNKQLTFEIHKYTKQPIAYIENDAVGCYDRIMNPLILLFLRILGLSPSAVASLAATWESTYHRIRTLYGISKEVYSNTSDRPLYGPGQGSTIGPFLWLLSFILIFLSIGDNIPRVTLSLVNDPAPLCFIGEAFVDDAGLVTNKGDNHQQLQVITLGDITTADGLIILPEVKQGIRIEDRPSTLQWPTQGDPPQSEWRIWHQCLQSFEHKGKLLQPLGQWIAPSHQHWCHFLDLPNGTVYDTSKGFVSFYPLPSSWVLRSGYWYDSKQRTSCTGVPEGAFSVTIVSNSSTDGTLFQVKTSQNSIPPIMPVVFYSNRSCFLHKFTPSR